jgi:Sporulation related domain.
VVPTPATTPPPARKAEPAPLPTGGSSSVQIGAFSTPGQAESEYNAVVSRHSRFTRGATRRVQEVTASNGDTLYRTTVGGLSRQQADGLCNAIKAGGGDCFVR